MRITQNKTAWELNNSTGDIERGSATIFILIYFFFLSPAVMWYSYALAYDIGWPGLARLYFVVGSLLLGVMISSWLGWKFGQLIRRKRW